MNKYQEYQEALNVLKKIEEENTYKRIGLFNHTQCDIIQELVDQNKPLTLKEVIKEWEDDGYNWCASPNSKHIVLVKEKSDKYNGNYLKMININSITKTYSCYIDESYSFDDITFQEHIRLTKTFRALGWEV